MDANGNPVNLGLPFGMTRIIFIPIMYGVSTYLMTLFSIWLYNVFYKKIGGVELEFGEKNLRYDYNKKQEQNDEKSYYGNFFVFHDRVCFNATAFK